MAGKIMRNGVEYGGSSGGSGNANMVTLTWEEYQALPDTKLTDGVQYYISDGGGEIPEIPETGFKNVFSFEETRIGTWVDGRPLYRKIIDFGELPSNNTKTIVHDIQNVKHAHINLGESFWFNKNKQIENSFGNTFVFTDYIKSVQAEDNNRIIIGTNNSGASAYKAYICVEYTKTTDEPEGGA